MDVKTAIMDNLFGRVMKDGKRIPGTRVLVFGTRIFFDDYLLPDDTIICAGLTDYISMCRRGKYRNVEFLPDSEIKRMAEDGTMYNYMERKYDMRKFDLVVSNPPYDGDLHLRILDQFLKIAKQCVFVHPARWMEDVLAQYKAKSATGKKFEHLKTALTKVMLIRQKDGCDVFNIQLKQDMLVGEYSKTDVNSSLPIYDNPTRYFTVLRKILDYAHDIKSLGSVVEDKVMDGIRVQVFSIKPMVDYVKDPKCASAEYHVKVVGKDVIEDGAVGGVFWANANKKNTKTHGKAIGTPIPHSIQFKTIELAQIFIGLYHTGLMKNIINMLKFDVHIEFQHIPYFDPRTIKTEDDVLDALGITDLEHRTWLKRKVYDYREKDFIRYNEWIDC